MWVIAEIMDVGLCCYIWYAAGLPLAVTIFAITVTPILLCHISTVIARSKITVKRYENKSWEMVKCKSCTVGMQYLRDDGKQLSWGPIPEGVRIAQKKSRIFHPPQANIRRCNSCAGSGEVAVRTKAYKDGNEPDALDPTEWPTR